MKTNSKASSLKEKKTCKSPIERYYDLILDGKVTVSKKVRRVYQKLVYDIKNPTEKWVYDSKRAEHPIRFIEAFCRHSKGAGGGKPFKLELWQKALVAATFGFINPTTRERKYREIILIVARKNGKSTLGAAIALYMFLADGEAGPEIVSAATKRDQAKIIWLEAKRMVRKSPTLSKMCRCLVGEIACDRNDGSFKPLSSESSTLDGLNPHCSLIDELHAITDMNLYDVIIDGMSAREQPLSIITTTAGTVREGIFDRKYDECDRIIKGYDDPKGYHDDRVLPIIYELDSRKEWQDPACWQKANPGLGTIKSLDMLKDKVERAKANPMLVSNLLTKDFNVRETTSEAWLTFEQLNNETLFNVKDLKPKYGIGGVDLSQTTDLTCATVIFRVPDDEHIYVLQMYWLPEETLIDREAEDKIPYSKWKELGLLRTTPGRKVDYRFVVQWFEEVRQEYDLYLLYCGYDSWSAGYFVEEMKSLFGSETMEPVIQGKKTLSAPMGNLGADLASKLIIYNNNPILKWCISNTSVDVDRNGNIQPCKANSRRRIDGLASLLDAYVVLERHKEDYAAMI